MGNDPYHKAATCRQGVMGEADVLQSLATPGAAALQQLREVLIAPGDVREDVIRQLMGVPEVGAEALAELIGVADQDTMARLELLRAIRAVFGEC